VGGEGGSGVVKGGCRGEGVRNDTNIVCTYELKKNFKKKEEKTHHRKGLVEWPKV
jgi:hypothetical protein